MPPVQEWVTKREAELLADLTILEEALAEWARWELLWPRDEALALVRWSNVDNPSRWTLSDADYEWLNIPVSVAPSPS